VRVHPETGRKLVNVNANWTSRIVELSERESDALLRMLLEHVRLPDYQCRFRWHVNSMAFWDNRCTKHLAVHDAGPFHRKMQRTQIAGGPVA